MPNINASRPVVREENIWKNYQSFPYFAPHCASKRASPFIWTNLNPYFPSMFPSNFGWNWPNGSWEVI